MENYCGKDGKCNANLDTWTKCTFHKLDHSGACLYVGVTMCFNEEAMEDADGLEKDTDTRQDV